MPRVQYTAVDRGRLASGHSASTSYTIEVDFEDFPESMIRKGEFSETLDGAVEGWLDAVVYAYNIRTDIVADADREDWLELFSSVAGGETFQVDFTGTIASPGTYVTVALDGPRPTNEQHVLGYGWRFTFRCKTVP